MGAVTAGVIVGSSVAYSAYQQKRAAERAVKKQAAARRAAAEEFQPYRELGERGIQESGFLANPQQQYEFLQGNPLFEAALGNANQGSLARAAAGGRLGAGGTQSELFRNYILAASPLIDRQRQDVSNLLNYGMGAAGQVTPLISGIGDVQAAGIIGSANARSEGAMNLARIFSSYYGYGSGGGINNTPYDNRSVGPGQRAYFNG